MGGGLGRVTKHPDYYLSDGSVSFLTGNILFRVHKSFFERESEVFRTLFEDAAEEDPQSGSDIHPFTLPAEVKADEFAQLLWVWYDKEYSYRQQTKDNWVVILKLSSRWQFPKIKELAIRELETLNLSPAERISIYNEHGIDDDRLLNSYVELCKSPTVPSEADGNLLQMEALINVLQAREDAQRKAIKLGHESPTSACLEDETLREIVSRFFKKGLDLRPDGQSTGSEAQASNLNGEHPQGTTASSTITLEDPQVLNRNMRSQVDGPSSHTPNSSFHMDNEEKGSREKDQEDRVNNNDIRSRAEVEKQERAKQAKEREEKEKAEKAEKARQDKEREEKGKQEKARQAKEREEREKAEKEKKEKEMREREVSDRQRKAEEQKPPQNPGRGGKAWGK